MTDICQRIRAELQLCCGCRECQGKTAYNHDTECTLDETDDAARAVLTVLADHATWVDAKTSRKIRALIEELRQ